VANYILYYVRSCYGCVLLVTDVDRLDFSVGFVDWLGSAGFLDRSGMGGGPLLLLHAIKIRSFNGWEDKRLQIPRNLHTYRVAVLAVFWATAVGTAAAYVSLLGTTGAFLEGTFV